MAFRDPSEIEDTCKCNYFSKYRSCYTATVLGNIFKPGHLCGVYGLDLYDHGMCGLISFQEEIWKGGIRIQVAFVPVDAFDFYWDFDLVFSFFVFYRHFATTWLYILHFSNNICIRFLQTFRLYVALF